jgi:hypothetical protein
MRASGIRTVPYSVVPRLPGVRKGDFGLVIRNSTGDSTEFFYGDTSGPNGTTQLGECSGFLWQTLGEKESEDYSFIVFSGSGSGTADGDALGRMDKVVKAPDFQDRQHRQCAGSAPRSTRPPAPALPDGAA